MNTQTFGNEDARQIAPVYLVLAGDMTLDASLQRAWQCLLDYPAWQNFPLAKKISGVPGQEGEVVLLRKEEKGFTFPPYYARTIKVDPERRLIWKTYPEPGSEIDFFGIVDFKLHPESPRKTRFNYDLLYEFSVPHRNASELDEFRRQQLKNFEVLQAVIFPKLQKLAAQEG